MIDHCKIQTHFDFFIPPKNISEHFIIFILSHTAVPRSAPASEFSSLVAPQSNFGFLASHSNEVISVFLHNIFCMYVLIYSQSYHCSSGQVVFLLPSCTPILKKGLPRTAHIRYIMNWSRVNAVFLLAPSLLSCLIFHLFPLKLLLQLSLSVFIRQPPLPMSYA